ncbi:hypothetical protein IQ07DRAFT_594105 [Pyrenochaeta sp. DS3sAY3a]|nr:hypothetical protein IQ07DRAFT_594105 [Pyrenochaeta sp. DS3sAY3a]
MTAQMTAPSPYGAPQTQECAAAAQLPTHRPVSHYLVARPDSRDMDAAREGLAGKRSETAGVRFARLERSICLFGDSIFSLIFQPRGLQYSQHAKLASAWRSSEMNETGRQRRARLPPRQVLTLVLHGVQLLLAITITALEAYALRYVVYRFLVFPLIIVISTLVTCSFLITSKLYRPKLESVFAVAVLQVCMLLFWIIDLALVIRVASIWRDPSCDVGTGYEYQCNPLKRRFSGRLVQRSASSNARHGGFLVALVILAVVEVIMWTISLGVLVFDTLKPRPNSLSRDEMTPPQMSTLNPGVVHLPTPEIAINPWDYPAQEPSRSAPEPILPDDSDDGDDGPCLYGPHSLGIQRVDKR